MISQISPEINVNTKGYADVRIENCLNAELLNGWEKWSLKDVVHTIKVMKEKISSGELGYGMILKFFGQIILNKILDEVSNSNSHFDLIKETVHIVLESEVSIGGQGVLDFYVGFGKNSRKYLCNFFSALIKYGEKDIRYYDLIYKMLTFQRRFNESFPLGFCMNSPEFNEQVLDKLPPKMKEQLKQMSITVNKDNGFDEYNLLTGFCFWID